METSDGEQAQEVSLEDLEATKYSETKYLLSIPGMRESILAGMTVPKSDCSEELPW